MRANGVGDVDPYIRKVAAVSQELRLREQHHEKRKKSGKNMNAMQAVQIIR